MSQPEAAEGGRMRVLPLAAMALGVFVIANDVTALSVALPEIERDFDVRVSTAQWVINAYALVFGVLIVTGGRLADMFGRRRIFFLGSAIFVGFSLLGTLAPSAIWLIVCRALMGVGGAMMWPAVLGMTYALLPEDKAGLAGGLIIGAAGFGNAAGPLIGGRSPPSTGDSSSSSTCRWRPSPAPSPTTPSRSRRSNAHARGSTTPA